MSIDLAGSREARKALGKIADGIGKASEETLEQTGADVLEKVKARTPVRTGRLKRGHKMKMLSEKSLLLYNEVEYAGSVEFGHSGAEPEPHWRPALEAAKRDIPERFVKNMRRSESVS